MRDGRRARRVSWNRAARSVDEKPWVIRLKEFHDDPVRVGARVRGKIAFEHATARPELLDAGEIVWFRRLCEFSRGGWGGPRIPVKAAAGHAQTPQFDDHIGAGRHFRNPPFPGVEDLFLFARIGANPR